MEFSLLGPLSIADRGVDRTPSAPKQRQMIALMMLNANRTISRSLLVQELWEFEPPDSAAAAVHTYIMQLRRRLNSRHAADGGGRLVTRQHGYQLVAHPGELDLDVFEERLRGAHRSLTAGDVAAAGQQLREAFEVWKAPVLVDVAPGPLLRAAIAAIERKWLDAVGQRVEIDLRLGRHHELIGELSALAQRYPTNEQFTAHLMVALYRSGRQADALARFHRLRNTLRGELRIGPSAWMHKLYTDILSADPKLELVSDAQSRVSLDTISALAS